MPNDTHSIPMQGTLLGRVWQPRVNGPSVVTLRDGRVIDITSQKAATVRDICEMVDPVGYVKSTPGLDIGDKDELKPTSPSFPNDRNDISKQYYKDNSDVSSQTIERDEVNPFNALNDELHISEKEIVEAYADEVSASSELKKGDVLSGVVQDISPLGASLNFGERTGFLNVTDIAWKRLSHPSKVLDIGDTVDVLVLEVDAENDKIMVGMKQMKDDPWHKGRESKLSFGAGAVLAGSTSSPDPPFPRGHVGGGPPDPIP